MTVTSCLHFECDQYFGNYDIIDFLSIQYRPSAEVDVTVVVDDILYFFHFSWKMNNTISSESLALQAIHMK